MRHVIQGDVDFSIEAPGAKLYDFHTPEYTLTLPANMRQKFVSQGGFHLGKNAKQNRVQLVGQ
jgi:hypothetical protein